MNPTLDRLQQLVAEKFSRQTDALRLFEPFEKQRIFAESQAFVRLMRGGQRSSKTLTIAVETARAALKRDPHGKFPTDRPLTIWCLAKSENHIGRVFWENLFRPGAFSICRDPTTNSWRVFRPWPKDEIREGNYGDDGRNLQVRRAPPLIPKTEYSVKDVGWRDKKERAFSVVRLKNETEIHAFSGNGDPPTGNKVDWIWIDEDIEDVNFIYEMVTRTIDLKGRLGWSAFPHSKNDVLSNLSNMAQEQENLPNPDVMEVHIRTGDNPYLSVEQMAKVRSVLSMDAEQLQTRDEGEFLTDSVLMYPSFSRDVHIVPHKPDTTRIDRLLPKGEIPDHWTRYIILDPGHTVAAALFAAVPPGPGEDLVVAYDEVYMRNANAERFVQAIRDKAGMDRFHAFLIDDCGSRVSDAGSGRPIRAQYSEQFAKQELYSTTTGNGFIPGSTDRLARSNEVRNALIIRPDGTPKFNVLMGRCPQLVNEFRLYKKQVKRAANGTMYIEDVADPKSKFSHLMNTLEYLMAYRPTWHPAPPRPQRQTALDAFHRFMNQGREQENYVWLGPGTGA